MLLNSAGLPEMLPKSLGHCTMTIGVRAVTCLKLLKTNRINIDYLRGDDLSNEWLFCRWRPMLEKSIRYAVAYRYPLFPATECDWGINMPDPASTVLHLDTSLYIVNFMTPGAGFLCLFVWSLWVKIFIPLYNFSLIWKRNHYRWRAANFDLISALMAIDKWRFFSVPHLLWDGTST